MKKFLKVTGLVITIPVGLFIILAALLYVPAIQNFVVDKVTAAVSKQGDMQISIDNVRLGFPLRLHINGVEVLSPKQDTLLSAEQLRVHIQLLPLLRKQIEVDGISLRDVHMNTGDLIPSMTLQGSLGEFRLSSHGVALTPEVAIVNEALLRNTDLTIRFREDTEEPDTTTSSPVYWKILLESLRCEKVNVALQLSDTTRMAVGLGDLTLAGGEVDLRHSAYKLAHLRLQGGAFSMDSDTLEAQPSLDPGHLHLTDWNMEIDSVAYSGMQLGAVIKNLTLKERSGLQITTFTGRLYSDDETLHIPQLRLETPDSYVEARGDMAWKALEPNDDATMSLRLLGELGKQDMLLLAGGMPAEFVRTYPNRPLTLRAGIDGNMKSLHITGLQSGLDGVFELRVQGFINDLLDENKRHGQIDLEAKTHNLDCAKALTGINDSTLVIPHGITLSGKAGIDGPHYTADMTMAEGTALITLLADCRTDKETYQATLAVDSLMGTDFLPHDSLRCVSMTLDVKGKGFDLFQPQTHMKADLKVDRLQYAAYDLSDVGLQAELAQNKAQLELHSHNALLDMTTTFNAELRRRGVNGQLVVDVNSADLKRLQVAAAPFDVGALFTLDFSTNFRKRHWLKGALENLTFTSEKSTFRTKNLYFDANLRADTTCMNAQAGDLNLHIDGQQDIMTIVNALSTFGSELSTQAQDKWLDQNKLKSLLPNLCVRVKAGTDNPIYNFLSINGFKYDDLFLDVDTSPEEGITGESHIYSLRTDSLQLDTIRLDIMQDTLGVKLFAEVRNAPTNKHFVFDSRLNAFIHPKGAGLELNYFDSKGEQGVHLGLNVSMADKGLRLKFYPEQPIIAFSPYTLNRDNFIYLYNDGRIDADLQLENEEGTAFQLYSTPNTDALRDLTLSLHKVDIGKLMEVLPYLPDIEGIWNAEVHYIQSREENMSVAVDTSVDSLVYEHIPLGDVACSAIYLPKEGDTHFVDARISLGSDEVASLSGDYRNTEEGALDMMLNLNHLPLNLVNGFIPDQLITLQGDLDGEVTVKGSTSAPRIDGQLALDSVTLASDMYGIRFRLDNRPVKIENSKLTLDEFSVYTRTDNPFRLSGTVDFADMANMMLDLRMVARNYELINASRKKNSVLYGKVYIDVFSNLRGTMDNLKMRGNINVQGNTDVTYVLKDSPLTVEDRLSDLVTFVNFNDTTTVENIQPPLYTAGGINMLMTLHIDEGAQARVNLSDDGESYISLNGGGNLSMQYTPQGELLLSGRYTVINGQMKYELPVIPLKTFNLRSGSFVEFTGNPMNPNMNIVATERVRSTVTENDVPRSVNFDVGVAITNSLENMGLEFTLEAPEDASIQNQLVAMSKEERGKLAVAMLATGMYLGEGGGTGKSGGFDANSALNSFLQSEITNIAGNALKTVDITLGMEDATSADGSQHTDYSFRFAKRFWNNRISIVIGGRISTGNDDPTTSGSSNSFIDDISLEWRLDDSGTRYIRIFHNTNFDSMLDGEITETGAGIVLRKKVSKLGELFIFRNRKKQQRRNEPTTTENK